MRDSERSSTYRKLLSDINNNIISHPVVRRRTQPFIRAAANGASRLNYPTMLTWNVTKACNLSCTYCAASALRGRVRSTPESRNAILEQIVEMQPVFVSLLGGEPTLAPEIGEIITTLVENDIHADMTTNGIRVTTELARLYASLDPGTYSLMLSLDSYDSATNDSIRGRGSHDTILRAAKELHSAGVKFSLGMTIGASNIHHLTQTYKLASDIGASSFCAWFIMPAGRGTSAESILPDDEFVAQAYEVLNLSAAGETKIGRLDLSPAIMKWLKRDAVDLGISQSTSELASCVGCEGCRYRILIDEDGTVYPCDFLQVPEFRMGNLFENNWNEIWNSRAAKLKLLLTRKTKPGCRTCPLQDCDTGCFGVSFAHYKETGELLPMCEVC